MVKEIKRDYYLEQLIKREGNGLIKIVTGIRRVLFLSRNAPKYTSVIHNRNLLH